MPPWLPSPRRRRIARAAADLDRLVYGIIATRRAQVALAPRITLGLKQGMRMRVHRRAA